MSIRQTKAGKWELTVRHKELPTGRKFFTFDTEEEAIRYNSQWALLVKAGLPPPTSLLDTKPSATNLGHVLRIWASSGNAAPSEHPTLDLLMTEVGSMPLVKVTYAWTEQWVRSLKTTNNLAPGSIKKRVGALSRAVDHHLRMTPDIQFANPMKLLPSGYAQYNERDKALVLAADKKVREDISRDRRLHDGEDAKIQAAFTDDAMKALYLTIVNTGLRLKEAYTLRVEQVDLQAKIIRAQKSKLWRGKVAYKDVPISPELFTALKNYVQSVTEPRLFPFWNGTDEDMKLVSTRLSQRFKVVFNRAGCADMTEHDLRHEATCRWFEMKNSAGQWIFRPEEINKIMGWAPGSAMAQRYASFRGESLASRMWS